VEEPLDEELPDVDGGVEGVVVVGAEEAGVAFSEVVDGSFFTLSVDSDDAPVGGFILSE
jgi:hypothetical protein